MAKKSVADDFDLGAEGEAAASPDALKRLRAAIQEQVDLQVAIEQMEDDLKAAKQTLQTIRTGRLPDIMAECQSDHFTHNGWEIKLSEFVSGSLPKDPVKRQLALKWLEKNGGAGLIKTVVAAQFGKGQHGEAVKLGKQMVKDGLAPTIESGVHSASLCSWGRTRIKDGDPIELETLGLFAGKIAKAKKVEE
tara:strand:+ start:439 stop:1014 length:576 start_codon:yes stop_codon:yes gene_type:complete